MAPEPMIAINDLRFGYSGAPDARPFSLRVPRLEVARAEKAACIGPSGSGKTTLVNILAGIIVPERGDVRVAGIELSALDDAARRRFRLGNVGLVFQELELLEHLTALDNILLRRIVAGNASEHRDAAAALAESLGIGHVLRRKPRRLSQGERQRVAICRALVLRPPLILCDEPTGNLDPDSTSATLDLIVEQADRLGSTVVMVTHNHQVLDRFDRVIDMRQLVGASA